MVSIGYPGPVLRGKPVSEPHNLGPGWVGFDFEAALGRPVKLVNDSAMQAIGSDEGGKMLFLGLGTGLGSAMVVDGVVEAMELGHLPYRKRTYEDYVGERGLERLGRKKWRRYVADVVARLTAALEPDYVVLGGGNVHKLKTLPPGCRAGDNANAFLGGFRLWDKAAKPPPVSESADREPAGQPATEKIEDDGCHRAAHSTTRLGRLEMHYQKLQDVHLRTLFAEDPGRGERLAAEAVGLYLDYSKNRVTDETLELL